MHNQQYLEDLISNQVEENLNLEYKAAGALERHDKKTNEISKDVSAFANSEGGIIIYGLTEIDHLPEKIDPIQRENISKEWLEQIINSKIRPRIDGVEIHPIEINNDKEKVVYLVEIPQSTTVHQADDQKYYKRFNFMSIPMYDYEIRDVMNRIKVPKISLEFEIVIQSIKTTGSNEEIPPNYYLNVYAKNEGSLLANYVCCYIKIPDKCIEDQYLLDKKIRLEGFYAENTARDVLDVEVRGETFIDKLGPTRYIPILPKMKIKLNCDIPRLHQYYRDYENEISWILYADNSEPRKGKIRFRDIDYKYN
ncbi:MAG: ATP-binding protein [Bacteroidales bacterium]|nr:ATP-binding protein [Bacteroidales bacterium]